MKRKKNEIQTNIFIYGYIWRFFLHIEKYAIFPQPDFYSEHEIRTRFV